MQPWKTTTFTLASTKRYRSNNRLCWSTGTDVYECTHNMAQKVEYSQAVSTTQNIPQLVDWIYDRSVAIET